MTGKTLAVGDFEGARLVCARVAGREVLLAERSATEISSGKR